MKRGSGRRVPDSLIWKGPGFRANFKYKHPESHEFLGPDRCHSLLLIAVRPRKSAIRCFLLYFQ
jgi:hypothetical protein